MMKVRVQQLPRAHLQFSLRSRPHPRPRLRPPHRHSRPRRHSRLRRRLPCRRRRNYLFLRRNHRCIQARAAFVKSLTLQRDL